MCRIVILKYTNFQTKKFVPVCIVLDRSQQKPNLKFSAVNKYLNIFLHLYIF